MMYLVAWKIQALLYVIWKQVKFSENKLHMFEVIDQIFAWLHGLVIDIILKLSFGFNPSRKVF